MTFYIQYFKADGQISGTNLTSGAAPPVLADDPLTGQLAFDAWFNHMGKRVNLTTLEIEDCPIYAKNMHNNNILSQLAALDAKTMRAYRDFILTGDKTAIQNIEAAAAMLRPQLIKD